MTIADLRRLSDTELVNATARLITLEYQCLAAQIVHIMEIDGRRLHWRAGFSNLALYLVERFALSEDQAYKRIRVARVAGFFPQVLTLLRRGETTLTNLALAAPRLTEANCELILDNIRGQTKRQAAAFLARVSDSGELVNGDDPEVELKIRVPRQLLEKLQRAREVMAARGKNPKTAEVIAAAVESLLERRDPLRRAERAAARKEKTPAAQRRLSPDTRRPPNAMAKGHRRRHIAAAVRNEVWLRDGGRCTYEAADGRRCSERAMLEIDHVVPVCRGGGNEAVNLRLRCRAHNQFAAELVLNPVFMARKRGDHHLVGAIKRETVQQALLVPEPVDLAGMGLT